MSVFRRIQVGELIFESAQDGITAHAGGGQASAFNLGPVEMNRVTTVATVGDTPDTCLSIWNWLYAP